MLRQDYILRLIEELVQVLHDSLGLTRNGEYGDALDRINRAFEDFFGWDSNFVNSMPEEYLLEMMRQAETLDPNKVALLAVLLKAEGDVYEAQGQERKAYHRYLRALDLLLAVSGPGQRTSLPDHLDPLKELLTKLAPYQLPALTRYRLWHYHYSSGDYAEAEDAFFDLLPEMEPEALLEEGITMYRDLLAKSDEELVEGGLPRKEVEETLSELEALLDQQGGGTET